MKTLYKALLGIGVGYAVLKPQAAAAPAAAGTTATTMTPVGVAPLGGMVGHLYNPPTGEAGAAADTLMTRGQQAQADIDARTRQTLEQTAAGQELIDAERRTEDAVNSSFVTADNTTATAIRFMTFGG